MIESYHSYVNKCTVYIGGDDKKILVWKLREAVEGTAVPRSMKCKHQSNIFCVNFDHDNKLLITAGK